jgi:hypothetical protein
MARQELGYQSRTTAPSPWKWYAAVAQASIGLALFVMIVCVSLASFADNYLNGELVGCLLAAASLACFGYPAWAIFRHAWQVLSRRGQ